MSDIRRVAVYCRVSTDREEQLGSLENQRSFFSSFISSQEGWSLAGIYSDEGKSGTATAKRDGFNRMISDCKRGLIDTVITKEISRFARNTVDTLEYTRLLKKLGINVIFISDGIDTAHEDSELRLSLMACIAQEESRRTSERVKWGQRRQMEKGVVFGRDLLGYDVRNGVLSINESGAEVVRLIFRKYAAEGKGSHVIARELNEAHIPSFKRGTWKSSAVLRILRNEKYAGDLCQGKTFTPDPLDHAKKIQPDPSQLVFIPAHHEPIISRELWELAQSELARRSPKRSAAPVQSRKYAFSGKVVCGVCGRHFVRRIKTLSSGEVYIAWRCATPCKGGCPSVNEKVLLSAVNFVLGSLDIDTAALADTAIDRLKLAAKSESSSADKLSRRLRELDAAAVNLTRKLADGIISDCEYSACKQQLTAESELCRKKIAELTLNKPDFSSLRPAITQKLSFQQSDTFICGAVTKSITVLPDNVLKLHLNGLPCPVNLHYTAKGRGNSYSVSFSDVQ